MWLRSARPSRRGPAGGLVSASRSVLYASREDGRWQAAAAAEAAPPARGGLGGRGERMSERAARRKPQTPAVEAARRPPLALGLPRARGAARRGDRDRADPLERGLDRPPVRRRAAAVHRPERSRGDAPGARHAASARARAARAAAAPAASAACDHDQDGGDDHEHDCRRRRRPPRPDHDDPDDDRRRRTTRDDDHGRRRSARQVDGQARRHAVLDRHPVRDERQGAPAPESQHRPRRRSRSARRWSSK